MSRRPPDTDAGVSETTPSPRARRTKQILFVIVVLILGAVAWGIVADFLRPAETTERRVRRLLHRMKRPTLSERLLPGLRLPGKRESTAKVRYELAGLGEAAVPHLIRILGAPDEDQTMRLNAGHTLWMIGPPAAPEQAVSVLMRTLRDKDSRVATMAAEILGKYGPAAKDAVPLLVELLQHGDWGHGDWGSQLRSSAVSSLVKIGPPAADALIPALGSDNVDVRVVAAMVLAKMKSVPRAATPALIRLMADENAAVRVWAAMALGRVTPAAREAIPALRKALKAQEDVVRRAVAEALAKIERSTSTKPGRER